jgi:hypothetical protein
LEKIFYFEKTHLPATTLAFVNFKVVGLGPGANTTIVSYNAASSLVRLGNKNIFFYFEKTHQSTSTGAL